MYALIFESSRIFAGLSDCIMLHPSYARKFDSLCRAAESYASRVIREFASGRIGLKDVEEMIGEVEGEVESRLGRLKVEGQELFLIPHIFSVNRIVCSGKIELSPEIQIYACLNTEKVRKELKKLRKAEIKAIRSGKASNVSKVNELEGLMLGYPECCVREFSRRKKLRNSGKNVRSLEGEIVEEYLEFGLNDVLEKLMKKEVNIGDVGDRIPKSLFAFNFYPCSLKCRSAEKAGEKCKEVLDGRLKGLFEAGAVAAMCDIEAICVKMGKAKGKDYVYLSPDEIISRVLFDSYA